MTGGLPVWLEMGGSRSACRLEHNMLTFWPIILLILQFLEFLPIILPPAPIILLIHPIITLPVAIPNSEIMM